jgi:general stress protein 26
MRSPVPGNVRRLRRLVKGIPIGMLTTQTAAGEPRSRPMLVQDVDDSGWLWFLTDRGSRKACELIQNPQASVVFQSGRGDRFVSVQGTAVIIRDDVQLRRLWNPTYRAWFPRGATDQAIVLIALRATQVEYWLVPRSRLVRVAGALKAMITGRRFEAGFHGVLDLQPLMA